MQWSFYNLFLMVH